MCDCWASTRPSCVSPVVKLRASELAPERELHQIGCELIGLDSIAAAREIVTVAVEALAAAGYRTGIFSGNPWVTREWGFDQGVDRFVSIYDERFARVKPSRTASFWHAIL